MTNLSKWKQFILEDYIPSSSTEEHNIIFLQKNENFDRESAEKFVQEVNKNSVWLKDFKINHMIGVGVQGRVYDFVDANFVMKIFSSDMAFERDIERSKAMIDQMFGGSASLEDMHYFDVGEVSELYINDEEKNIYYMIMPKIELVKNTPEFKSNKRNNEHFFRNIAAFAQTSIMEERTFADAAQFKESFLKFLEKISEEGDPQKSWLNFSINFDFPKKADAYLNAAYRAYTQGGLDLHSGNIGFFPTNPDKFFYFDM